MHVKNVRAGEPDARGFCPDGHDGRLIRPGLEAPNRRRAADYPVGAVAMHAGFVRNDARGFCPAPPSLPGSSWAWLTRVMSKASQGSVFLSGVMHARFVQNRNGEVMDAETVRRPKGLPRGLKLRRDEAAERCTRILSGRLCGWLIHLNIRGNGRDRILSGVMHAKIGQRRSGHLMHAKSVRQAASCSSFFCFQSSFRLRSVMRSLSPCLAGSSSRSYSGSG